MGETPNATAAHVHLRRCSFGDRVQLQQATVLGMAQLK